MFSVLLYVNSNARKNSLSQFCYCLFNFDFFTVSHGKDAGRTSKEQEHEKQMSNQPHRHRHHYEIYNFVYILHPKAVTGFSWRQKSRQMPLYVADAFVF